jgi:hypothetical protein
VPRGLQWIGMGRGMKKILATDQEIATLRVLIHRAVLHDGMDVAEAAVMWGHKLKVAEAAGEEPEDVVR